MGVLDGSVWSASRPGRFTPREGAPDTHCIGGWEVPELVWTLWRREQFLPLPEIEPRPFSSWPVAIPTEISRLHTFSHILCRKYCNKKTIRNRDFDKSTVLGNVIFAEDLFLTWCTLILVCPSRPLRTSSMTYGRHYYFLTINCFINSIGRINYRCTLSWHFLTVLQCP
jgi:hypothetical protein